jgi:hypothetical protein
MAEKTTDKKPDTDAPEKTDKKAGPPPSSAPALIPVKEMWFTRDVFIPGRKMTSGCKTTEPTTGAYWRVFFDRALRHHRIEHYAPAEGNKVERAPAAVRYYPESWASWEPLT